MEQFARTIQKIHEKQYVVLNLDPHNLMFKRNFYEIESIYLVDLGALKKIGEKIGVTANIYSPPEYIAVDYINNF